MFKKGPEPELRVFVNKCPILKRLWRPTASHTVGSISNCGRNEKVPGGPLTLIPIEECCGEPTPLGWEGRDNGVRRGK